jgi:hypothetical protein
MKLIKKNEKIRLGLLGKLKSSTFSNPEKDMAKTFNSCLSIINDTLDGYFYIQEVSTADVEEVGDKLVISEKDSFTSPDGKKFTLQLTMESYFSESYGKRNTSFIFSIMKQSRNREEKFCYEKINDSVDDMKKSIKQISEKALKRLNDYTKSLVGEEKERDGVIKKVGDKWKILKKDRKHYWDADYDTKKDAEDALKAYWANKHESRNLTIEQRIKRLESLVNKSLVDRYKNK